MEEIEELPSSSAISVYSDAIVNPPPSCTQGCCSYTWSLISSPFYKTEISTLSLVHLICTLAIGISLSISVETEEVKHVTQSSLYLFLIIYMLISIGWLFGAICFGSKTGCCLARRQHEGHIPGYLIIGVTFLCIGSSFLSAVEVLPFVFSRNCKNITHNKQVNKELVSEAIFSLTKFVFLILQLYFFCRFSNKTFLESSAMRFFLMHLIAVNLCTWFYIIVDESVSHDLPKYKSICPPFKTMENFREAIDGYLYPFSIEYSVMSSVLFLLLWYRLKPHDNEPQAPAPSAVRQGSPVNTCCQRIQSFLVEKCFSESITKGVRKPIAFWKSAICGYVLGVAMLVYILAIVAVLAVEFTYNQNMAVYLYYGSRIAINCLMSIVCLFGLKCLKNHQMSEQTTHTIVDTALIMIGVSGCYLFTGFEVISASSFVTGDNCTINDTAFPATNLTCTYLGVNIADSSCSLFQFTLQAFFIVRALKRCSRYIGLVPGKREISSALVVRRCSAFLSIANIGLWAMNTFELQDSEEFESAETHAFTRNTWKILSHVASPMCIFFRLHSFFCCFEIVINRFEVSVLPEDEHDQPYAPVPSDEENGELLERLNQLRS